MSVYETDYRGLLLKVMGQGDKQEGRNGWVKSLFNVPLSVDLSKGFPLLQARKMFTAGIFGEMCCFLRGCEDLASYTEMGCNYWTENAGKWDVNKDKAEHDMLIGQYVGSLWRDFSSAEEIQFGSYTPRDQLFELYHSLRNNPLSRRHVLSAWHPGAEACLPPCTVMAIFDVRGGRLNCHVTQRSADLCLGVPSDVAGYALLIHTLCAALGYLPGTLAFSFINLHVYQKHEAGVWEYMQKLPSNSLPTLRIESEFEGFELVTRLLPGQIILENYKPQEIIKFPFVA